MTRDSLYTSNIPNQKGGTCLFLIDMQRDFMDFTEDPKPALSVAGGCEDAKKVADFIAANQQKLVEIYATFDSHKSYHIAHKSFWGCLHDEVPCNFEFIRSDQVVPNPSNMSKDELEELLEKYPAGETKWYYPMRHDVKYCKEYTKQIESSKTKRRLGMTEDTPFFLTIWPDHCIIGSQNHALEDNVYQAIHDWEVAQQKSMHVITKGHNSLSEHYSAFKAEHVIDKDVNTTFNDPLFDSLMTHETIIVAGEASSHCVNYSVRDFIRAFETGGFMRPKTLVILKDCMSPVGGFEQAETEFFKYLEETARRFKMTGKKLQIRLCTLKEWESEWANMK